MKNAYKIHRDLLKLKIYTSIKNGVVKQNKAGRKCKYVVKKVEKSYQTNRGRKNALISRFNKISQIERKSR